MTQFLQAGCWCQYIWQWNEIKAEQRITENGPVFNTAQ